jgi:hypothetical protein
MNGNYFDKGTVRMKIGRIALIVAVIIGIACGGGVVSAADQPLSVLFAGYRHHRIAHVQARDLMERGYNVDEMPTDLSRVTLDRDMLRKYNVVVLMGVGPSNADFSLTERNVSNIKVLQEYIAEGGGVIFIPTLVQNSGVIPPQKEFVQKYGVELFFNEVPFSASAQVATPWKIPFAYTDVVTSHVVTAGVSGLWYPVATRRGGQDHTIPFTVDTQWQVVVASSSDTMTRDCGLEKWEGFDSFPAGQFKGNMPLVALRDVGKGRLALWSIVPEYLFGEDTFSSLNGVVYREGIGGKGSDGIKLIDNLLRYCAAPSLSQEGFGGAPMNRSLLVNPLEVTQWAPPWDWQKSSAPPMKRKFPGVVGARTARTTGKNSVAQWAAAAKKEGLAYLVFLETFSELTRDEFESLKKECATLSDDTLTLIPGFTIDDEIGNHYFYCGSIPYPEARLLDKEGKHFVAYDPEVDKHIGQMSMTTLIYTHSISSVNLTAGNYLFTSDASPCANWFSNFDVVGVYTRENGVEKENAIEEYLKIADAGQFPHPVALELMDSVEYLSGNSMRTVLQLDSASAITKFWNSWKVYTKNPSEMYITQGPSIDLWGFEGSRDYEGSNRGDFVWQNFRWDLHGRVSSEKGLREVLVMDGETLYRRFDPRGKKEFAFTLELTHEKQHNLVLIAVDSEGRRAISEEQIDKSHRFQEFNCADRNNQLAYAYVLNHNNIPIKHGGYKITPNKRLGGAEIAPAGAFRNGILHFSGFDGGVDGDPTYIEETTLRNATSEVRFPRGVESRRLLHTQDVHIGAADYRWNFTDTIDVHNVWHTMWATEPAEAFTMKRRFHGFQIDPENPLALFIWETEIELLQDADLSRGIFLGRIRSSNDQRWAFLDSTGRAATGRWDDEKKYSAGALRVPLDGSGYVAYLDSNLGGMALFSLTPGLYAEVNPAVKSDATFYLTPEASAHKKGDTIHISMMFMGIPRMTEYSATVAKDSYATVQKFYQQFAVAPDSTPGYSLNLTQGQLKQYGYPLALTMDEEGAVVFTAEGDLITSLAIRAEQACDNWSAYLYDYEIGKSRPLGVFDSAAWATVTLHGKKRFFIGHPVSCDNRDVVIQLTRKGLDTWGLELHNPTAEDLVVSLKQAAAFEPLEGISFPQKPIAIKAGESVNIDLEFN